MKKSKIYRGSNLRGSTHRSFRRVLFISNELIAADLAYRLKCEGCDVRLYIQNPELRECFDGMVAKSRDWRNDLPWVGEDGLIVFDDVGYGREQDTLRRKGYAVIGGSADGDRLELDREYGQAVLRAAGVTSSSFETKTMTLSEAIAEVKARKGEWVVKQADHNTALNYVGELPDGSDVLAMLEYYKSSYGGRQRVTLQKRVRGVEIAVGRFFNGNQWAGPIVVNIEHKHLCDGDVGPLGGETGTVMWYERDEKNKLFQKTLAKLSPHLQRTGYKGYIDINCIVQGPKHLFPLEVTARFGSSTIETQCELHKSPWWDFLQSVARGRHYELKNREGYALAVALTIPPFPYRTTDPRLAHRGLPITFADEIQPDDFNHIHFEGLSRCTGMGGRTTYITAGNLGYVLYITGSGRTVQVARNRIYKIIEKIKIPKMFYRQDIGTRFVARDQDQLRDWGWIR